MTKPNTWTSRAAALFAFAIVVVTMLGTAHAGEPVFGTWQHPENGSLIETYPCGANLCAKIKKIADGQATDHRNVDPDLRSRPIVGLVIVSQATKVSAS